MSKIDPKAIVYSFKNQYQKFGGGLNESDNEINFPKGGYKDDMIDVLSKIRKELFSCTRQDRPCPFLVPENSDNGKAWGIEFVKNTNDDSTILFKLSTPTGEVFPSIACDDKDKTFKLELLSMHMAGEVELKITIPLDYRVDGRRTGMDHEGKSMIIRPQSDEDYKYFTWEPSHPDYLKEVVKTIINGCVEIVNEKYYISARYHEFLRSRETGNSDTIEDARNRKPVKRMLSFLDVDDFDPNSPQFEGIGVGRNHRKGRQPNPAVGKYIKSRLKLNENDELDPSQDEYADNQQEQTSQEQDPKYLSQKQVGEIVLTSLLAYGEKIMDDIKANPEDLRQNHEMNVRTLFKAKIGEARELPQLQRFPLDPMTTVIARGSDKEGYHSVIVATPTTDGGVKISILSKNELNLIDKFTILPSEFSNLEQTGSRIASVILEASEVPITESSKDNGIYAYKKYNGVCLMNLSKKELQDAIREEKSELKKLKSALSKISEDSREARTTRKAITATEEKIEILEKRLEFVSNKTDLSEGRTKTNKTAKKMNEGKDESEDDTDTDTEQTDDDADDATSTDDRNENKSDDEPEDETEVGEVHSFRIEVVNPDKVIEYLVEYGIPESEIEVDREDTEDGEDKSEETENIATLTIPAKYVSELKDCLKKEMDTDLSELVGGEFVTDDDTDDFDDTERADDDDEEANPEDVTDDDLFNLENL